MTPKPGISNSPEIKLFIPWKYTKHCTQKHLWIRPVHSCVCVEGLYATPLGGVSYLTESSLALNMLHRCVSVCVSVHTNTQTHTLLSFTAENKWVKFQDMEVGGVWAAILCFSCNVYTFLPGECIEALWLVWAKRCWGTETTNKSISTTF